MVDDLEVAERGEIRGLLTSRQGTYGANRARNDARYKKLVVRHNRPAFRKRVDLDISLL